MYRSRRFVHRSRRFSGLPLAAVLVTTMSTVMAPGGFSSVGLVHAAESGHSGGHGGGHSGHVVGGGHSGVVHDHTDSDHSGRGGPNRHGGAHGLGHAHDIARGAGKSVESRIFRGRRPVWAREGIPEVELGRLNVSRAPAWVLNRHEEEALARYTQEMAALYSLPADAAAALLEAAYRTTARLDSPLQNLAMYQQVMTFGRTELEGIEAASQLDLAAIFLGSAADKNLAVTEDTVIALNRILGLKEMAAEDRAVLAGKANTVREAILVGHGPETSH